MIGPLLAWCALAAPQDVDLDRDRLAALVRASLEDLDDVEFVYEGSLVWLAPSKGRDADEYSTDYQGLLAYRHDDRYHVQYFEHPRVSTKRFRVKTCASVDNRLRERSRVPDSRPGPALQDRSSVGGAGSMAFPTSAFRLFMLPSFLEELANTSMPAELIKIGGWEEVDGHRCLKVTIGTPSIQRRYWLDLSRGCHPALYEFVFKDKLWVRTDQIVISSVPRKEGGPAWLPVRGRCQTFDSGDLVLVKAPQFEETYQVVDGTIRLSQRLPDARFSLDWQPPPGKDPLDKERQSFLAQSREAKVKAKARSKASVAKAGPNPEGAEATDRVEAVPPADRPWAFLGSGTFLLAILGTVVLGAAFLLRWRLSG